MPWNGSGTYAPPSAPTFPAVAGQVIVSTYYNAVINDIVTAFNNVLTRDGQGKPSATTNWNNQSLTGINNLTAANAGFSGFLSVTGTATFNGATTCTAGLTVNSLAFSGGAFLSAQYGGTGVNASAAANGKLLIGNGSGFSLANLTQGAGITITNSAGGITIAASGGGSSGTTSFPLTINNGGAGVASGTTFDGSAARTISYNSIGAKPDAGRIQSIASNASVTPTFGNDQVNITALVVGVTFNNPTGTAVDGWEIIIRIKSAAAQAITFGSQYRPFGGPLPTTTTAGKTMYIGMKYNAADTKWDVFPFQQEQ